MLMIPIMFMILCVVILLIFAAKFMLLSLLIAVVVAILIIVLWRTPDPEKAKQKKQVVLVGLLMSQLLMLPFAWQSANNKLFPDQTEVNAKRKEITELFERKDIDNKFDRSYAIAISAKEKWDQRNLHSHILETFLYTSVHTHFSTADLSEAQKYFDEAQASIPEAERNSCDPQPQKLFATIVAHRDGPVSVMNFIRDQYRDQDYCPELNSLMYIVKTKCQNEWANRCTLELDREILEDFLATRPESSVQREVQSFVQDVFSNR